MEKTRFTELEEKANELFGEKSLLSVAEVKAADKGYVVRIKMQGVPFEITAMKDTLEEAEELAYFEFKNNLNDSLEKSLFATQSADKYEEVKLTNQQLDRLYKYEESLDDEYLDELKIKTVAKLAKLDDGRYECVLESPYKCLHARGTASTKNLAILSAIMTAHDIFETYLIHVGNKPWKK